MDAAVLEMVLTAFEETRDDALGHGHDAPQALKEAMTAAGDPRRDFDEALRKAFSHEQVARVLEAPLARYADLPRGIDALAAWLGAERTEGGERGAKFVERRGESVFAFGRHQGRTLAEVAREAPDYLRWILLALEGTAIGYIDDMGTEDPSDDVLYNESAWAGGEDGKRRR